MSSHSRRLSRRQSSSALLTPPLSDQSSASGSAQRKVRVEPSADDDAPDFTFEVAPLAGDIPQESPVWRNITHGGNDRRPLGPMSVRWAAEGEGRLVESTKLQDDVRQSLWRKLRQLLPHDLPPQDFLPRIVFDETPEGQTIDLVFDNDAKGQRAMDAFIDNVDEIQAEKMGGGGGKWRTFEFVCCTNSLGGGIFPVDVHRLPLEKINVTDLCNGLQRIASPVGELLGIGKIVMSSHEWGLEQMEAGILRAYIKLSARTLSLSQAAFVKLLPTRLKWDGVEYSIFYAGRSFHAKHVVTKDYCPSTQVDGRGGEAEDSTLTPSATPVVERGSSNSNGNSAASSSSSAKKRRRTSRN